MKKILTIWTIVLSSALVASCSQTNETTTNSGSTTTVSSTGATSASGSTTTPGGQAGNQAGMIAKMIEYKKSDTVLQTLISEVAPKFQAFEYTDEATGKTLTYSLYIPENYDPKKEYPLVMFMGDSSTTGNGREYTLTQGHGALVWATAESQAKNPAFVLVPYFAGPDKAVTDEWTVSAEAELTIPMLQSVVKKYSINTKKIYTTGQSGGGMLSFYFNLKYPELFAASLFVGSQWDTNTLANFADKKFFYIVSAGDPKASAGMAAMETVFTENNISYAETEFAANAETTIREEETKKLISQNNPHNLILFTKGTTTTLDTSSGAGEHMFSFDWAYQIEAVRDWMFAQSK